VVFNSTRQCSVSAVFTLNRFCAAPVQICRERLARGHGHTGDVVNTGNANAGTGADGPRAQRCCDAAAALMGLEVAQVLPFSTGVIMEPLPVDRIEAGLPAAVADLAPDHWADAAEGIMTTDTCPRPPRGGSRSVVAP
jgi:glutamate N-acetyltransferase/amino-acid N-acetyltransferase